MYQCNFNVFLEKNNEALKTEEHFADAKLIVLWILNKSTLRGIEQQQYPELENFSNELPIETPALICANIPGYEAFKHYREEDKRQLQIEKIDWVAANHLMAHNYDIDIQKLPAAVILSMSDKKRYIVENRLGDLSSLINLTESISEWAINFPLDFDIQSFLENRGYGCRMDKRSHQQSHGFKQLSEFIFFKDGNLSLDGFLNNHFFKPSMKHYRNGFMQFLSDIFKGDDSHFQENDNELYQNWFSTLDHDLSDDQKMELKGHIEIVKNMMNMLDQPNKGVSKASIVRSAFINLATFFEQEIYSSLLSHIRKSINIDIKNRFLTFDEKANIQGDDKRFNKKSEQTYSYNDEEVHRLVFPPCSLITEEFNKRHSNSSDDVKPIKAFLRFRNGEVAHFNTHANENIDVEQYIQKHLSILRSSLQNIILIRKRDPAINASYLRSSIFELTKHHSDPLEHT